MFFASKVSFNQPLFVAVGPSRKHDAPMVVFSDGRALRACSSRPTAALSASHCIVKIISPTLCSLTPLTPLVPHCTGAYIWLSFQVSCPQNGSAVLKGRTNPFLNPTPDVCRQTTVQYLQIGCDGFYQLYQMFLIAPRSYSVRFLTFTFFPTNLVSFAMRTFFCQSSLVAV